MNPINFWRCVRCGSRRLQKLKPSYYLCYLYTRYQRRSIVFVLHNPRRFISIRSAVETRVVFTQSKSLASYIPLNGTEWLLKTKVLTVLLCLKPVVFSFGYINMLNLLYKFHDIYFYFKWISPRRISCCHFAASTLIFKRHRDDSALKANNGCHEGPERFHTFFASFVSHLILHLLLPPKRIHVPSAAAASAAHLWPIFV